MNSNAAKSKHGTWRDSMSGMARSVLLKAKDSIDTLRGASDPPRTNMENAATTSPRNYAATTDNLDVADNNTSDIKSHHLRATLSLHRVLHGSMRQSKRSPLLMNLMSKKSLSRLQNPECFTDEAVESGSSLSPAQTSLSNLQLHDSPRSKSPSQKSSLQINKTIKEDGVSCDVSTRASSPIPIPLSSPPPTINFDIESGKLSPNELFGSSDEDENSSGSSQRSNKILNMDVLIRDNMIIARRRSKRHMIKSELEKFRHEHIPRRSSNDHWRLRKFGLSKSAKQPNTSLSIVADTDPPSPMPGTTFPLEIDDLLEQAAVGLCASELLPNTSTEATLRSLEVGGFHADAPNLGSYEFSVCPFIMDQQDATDRAKSETGCVNNQDDPSLPLKTKADTFIDPETVKQELEAGRQAIQQLEHRLAEIEAEVRRNSSLQTTPAKSMKGMKEDIFSNNYNGNQVDGTCSSGDKVDISLKCSGVTLTNEETPSIPRRLFHIPRIDHCEDKKSLGDNSEDGPSMTNIESHLKKMQELAMNGKVLTDNPTTKELPEFNSEESSLGSSLPPILEASSPSQVLHRENISEETSELDLLDQLNLPRWSSPKLLPYPAINTSSRASTSTLLTRVFVREIDSDDSTSDNSSIVDGVEMLSVDI